MADFKEDPSANGIQEQGEDSGIFGALPLLVYGPLKVFMGSQPPSSFGEPKNIFEAFAMICSLTFPDQNPSQVDNPSFGKVKRVFLTLIQSSLTSAVRVTDSSEGFGSALDSSVAFIIPHPSSPFSLPSVVPSFYPGRCFPGSCFTGSQRLSFVHINVQIISRNLPGNEMKDVIF